MMIDRQLSDLDPAFLALSRRIGSEPMLIQGPGGNTSVKFGNVMWVKASGTSLSEAGRTQIFTKVDVGRSVSEIDAVPGEPAQDVRIDPSDGHRPSIETSFHALLPWKYVFHHHSAHALAHLTSPEGTAQAERLLSDMEPAVVEYRKPGIPLSKAIRAACSRNPSRVILLKNHGVIVCGESLDDVETLIDETEARLSLDPALADRLVATPSRFPGWQLLEDMDPFCRNSFLHDRLTGGCYFPDQVVFLGPGIPAASACDLESRQGLDAPVAVVRDVGVFVREGLQKAAVETLHCLMCIHLKAPPNWRLTSLSAAAVRELTDWDAEKYRRTLAKAADK